MSSHKYYRGREVSHGNYPKRFSDFEGMMKIEKEADSKCMKVIVTAHVMKSLFAKIFYNF